MTVSERVCILAEEQWMQKAFGNPKTKGALRKSAAAAGEITDAGTINKKWLEKETHAKGKLGQRARAAANANK